MPDAFDPYFKWLGIPKADQPPHGYRLLGIELYETDADVISNAADGRMAQIKSYQSGKFAAVSQKLLNEIAAAKVCLLNPQKKAEYDRRLRAHLEQKKTAADGKLEEPEVSEAVVAAEDSPAGLSFLDYSTAPKHTTTRPVKKSKQPAWLIPAGVGAIVIALVAGVVVYCSFAGDAKGKPSNSQTASLAASNREAQPNQTAKSSDKPGVGTSEKNREPTGIATAVATKETHDDPLPSAAQEPTSDPGPKPKTELVADSDQAAPPEKTPEKSTENAADKSVAVGPPVTENEPAKKPPIPDKEQFQAMKSKILKIFQKEFAEAKTPQSKLALVVKLNEQGDASKDDPVERYALWKIAADGACVAGEFSMAMNIVDKIAAQFDVDGNAMKAEILGTSAARTTIGPEVIRNLCETALKLASVATDREEFDAAAQFAKLAAAAAHRVKDPQFNRDVMSRGREIERLKARYASVAKAMETLGKDPDNAEANLSVGQWQCFAKGDWEIGLPYLAKGSRADLAKLAKQELAKPAGAKEQVALADSWWALAEKDRTDAKVIYQARAGHWYEQALPTLSGLEKTRAEKQIKLARTGPPVEVRGRGVLQRGNVALASNGTTVAGVQDDPELLLNGISDQKATCQSRLPCVFTITLDKVYLLRQIRFHLEETPYVIDAAYRVAVSRDGKNFELLEDHSKDVATGWQEMLFAARPVKAVKLEALTSKNCNRFILTQFEAYCYPVTATPPATKPR